MKFIALKTKDGSSKGNITFFCRVLHVSRQGYYQYLVMKDRPWKYQPLADAMKDILAEDICNDTYGRTDELKTIIWRYFTSYWNNRRICSTNRGLPPMIKRQQYYASLKEAA